jgi:hypothetical protein
VAGVALIGIAAGLVALGVQAAGAQGDREEEYERRPRAHLSGAARPVLAIVSLGDQRISLYGAGGKIQESPVSTGATGYETPAGIFSIVQKKEFHTSNLYEDGEMPYMQRITWTGIALHAGILPGRPASHGCVRLPMEFAQRLFDMTEMGMRVVIVRDDMRPSEIAQPALFKPKPVPRELGQAVPPRNTRLAALAPAGEVAPGSAQHLAALQSAAEVKAEEAETAAKRLREARAAVTRTASEAAAAGRALRAAEAGLAQAERALQDAERRVEKAVSPQDKERAEGAKAKAAAKVDEGRARLQAAKAQEQGKREAAERAGTEVTAAAEAKGLAAQAAQQAKLRTLPVSVFVSRKTQRLYVRRGNFPVFEGPVTIREPQAPIGTFVFTALEQTAAPPALRWSVVAMYRNPTRIEPPSPDRRTGSRNAAATPTDVVAAGAALDRVALTQEALDIVSDVVLPGSSLIVSDEGPSRETGKDTDFVVVMSDEPQGALKIRQRERGPVDEFDSPWGGSGRRSPGGGLPFFWKW